LTPLDFAHQLLHRLGLPESDSNLQALVAVQAVEGGHMANSAQFNPLNTMQGAPGARDAGLKVKGIKAYSSWDEGLEATAQTLTNGLYKNILASLARSAPADETVRAWGQSPWGWTKDAASKVGKAATYFAYYAHKEFPGGGSFSFLPSIPTTISDLFTMPASGPKKTAAVIVIGVTAVAGLALLVHMLRSSKTSSKSSSSPKPKMAMES
jgi:hypothetical protein